MEFIELWRRFRIQETTLGIVTAALEAKERWGLSYWDAAIVEAARASGCRELLSEDLADGQSSAACVSSIHFVVSIEAPLGGSLFPRRRHW